LDDLRGEAQIGLRPRAFEALNPRLAIQGVVLTMFDPRNNLSAQVVADVREFMAGRRPSRWMTSEARRR
jgi:cellulose biosynthesis protein BcsQ